MRKFIVAGLAVVVLGGVAGGAAVARAGGEPYSEVLALADPDQAVDMPLLAQNDPPPGPSGPGMPPAAPPGTPPGMPPRAGMDGGPRWMRGGPPPRPMWHRAAMFGLFFHPADKQLTPPDVQKIAEAFLLWQGNRDWKVAQVTAGPDGTIGFAFTTSDGGVIARFTMDSKTGRIARVG